MQIESKENMTVTNCRKHPQNLTIHSKNANWVSHTSTCMVWSTRAALSTELESLRSLISSVQRLGPSCHHTETTKLKPTLSRLSECYLFNPAFLPLDPLMFSITLFVYTVHFKVIVAPLHAYTPGMTW